MKPFAAQAIAVIKELNMDLDRVNVNGGAIALGHPLGATGSILMTKLLHEMERRDVKYGLVTLCIGGGQGITTILRTVRYRIGGKEMEVNKIAVIGKWNNGSWNCLYGCFIWI